MDLVCNMILQDYVIKELCDFIVGDHHAKFGGHNHSGSGVIITTRSKGHVILWIGPLMVSHHPANFVDQSRCGNGCI